MGCPYRNGGMENAWVKEEVLVISSGSSGLGLS